MTSNERKFARLILRREERLLLQRRFPLSVDLRQQLERESSRNLEVWLTADEADTLRDYAQDLLQTEGFDENYEPTDAGRMLEDMIDKLFTG